MNDLKTNRQENNVELLSDEAQEVMSRIPPAIVRWGMTVMAVIITGMLIAAAVIHWPETVEVPFDGQLQNGEAIITAKFPSEVIRFVLHHDNTPVSLYSPMLPDKYSESGVSGIIADISVLSNNIDSYSVNIKIELVNEAIADGSIISGTMVIITSNKSLLQHIIEQVRI